LALKLSNLISKYSPLNELIDQIENLKNIFDQKTAKKD
jgi:hypothetical protein